jgi:DNA polymerase-3 subunit delta'
MKIAPIFSEIKGQDEACRRLSGDLRSGQSDRSYLFHGSFGVDKIKIALALAKARYCSRGGCGKCDDCLRADGLIKQGLHPAISLIVPQGAQTKIDQVRKMLVSARMKAESGAARTFVIGDAESMNEQAANTLLKIIEEPPPHSAFILVTVNNEGILPTLVSRCREIKFRRPSLDELQELLCEQHGLEPAAARLEGALLGGGFALGGEKTELLSLRDEALAALRQADTGVSGQVQSAAGLAAGDRRASQQRVQMLYLWFRDVLLFKQLKEEDLFNIDKQRELAADAERWGEEYCLQAMEALEGARLDLAANANRKLLFEVALCRIFSGEAEVTANG